jgi:hypothetical protein
MNVPDLVKDAGPSPRAWRWILLLAVVLQLPSLRLGFFIDDHLHQLALADETGLVPIPRWNVYDFGRTADWQAFASEHGSSPWWTDPDWKARFLRPLPSLLLNVEHAVFGHRALGYHVVSLALWLLLVVLARRLYVGLGLSRGATLAALLVLVTTDASSVPVAWIANRNALLEGLFTVAALGTVLGLGPPPGRRQALTGVLLALLAALCKESGLVALLLVALVLDARGRTVGGAQRRHLRAAAGLALALALTWVGVFVLGDYGTRSGYYATPWVDPLRALGHLALLATGGMLSVLGPFSLDAAAAFPEHRLALSLVLGTLGLLVGVPLVRRGVRAIGGRPRMGWMAAWATVALLPRSGVLPGDRLLFVPTLALAPLLGTLWAVERAHWARVGRVPRAFLLSLGFSTIVLSGLFLVAQNAGLASIAEHLRTTTLAADVGPVGSGRRDGLVLQTESQMQAFALGPTWLGEGGDPDVRFQLLQAGARPLRWSHPAEDVHEFESLGTPFLIAPFESVYRSTTAPPTTGDRWRGDTFTVEATRVGADGLEAIRLTFDPPDPGVVRLFLRSENGVLAPVEGPPVGATVELAAPVRAGPFTP